jgi:hypothetical protein
MKRIDQHGTGGTGMCEMGIVMFDCEEHGRQFDRNWCPFCRIDDLEREVHDGIEAGWHKLRQERDALRKVLEEIEYQLEENPVGCKDQIYGIIRDLKRGSK